MPLIFASSTQALLNNNYGQSKRAAEHLILALKKETGNETHILRLPNVFGKWSKPNYNSVVATFCHNIANDLPINIDEPDKKLELLHIDDLIQELVQLISGKHVGNTFIDIAATFELTVKELAESLYKLNDGRNNLHIETVGSGVMRPYTQHLSVTYQKQDLNILCQTTLILVEILLKLLKHLMQVNFRISPQNQELQEVTIITQRQFPRHQRYSPLQI